jgi:hypothetical protein
MRFVNRYPWLSFLTFCTWLATGCCIAYCAAGLANHPGMPSLNGPFGFMLATAATGLFNVPATCFAAGYRAGVGTPVPHTEIYRVQTYELLWKGDDSCGTYGADGSRHITVLLKPTRGRETPVLCHLPEFNARQARVGKVCRLSYESAGDEVAGLSVGGWELVEVQ